MVRYHLEVTGLDDVDRLWLLTRDANISPSTGATSETSTRLAWDGRSATVGATLTPTGDPTADGSLEVAGEGWGFAPVPPLVVAWTAEGADGLQRLRPFEDRDDPRVQVESPPGGVVGQKYALVGETLIADTTSPDGRVRVIAPASPGSDVDVDRVAAALGRSAAAFDDGGGRVPSTVFVLPDGVRPGGATFVSSAETWVNAAAPLDSADNIWFHEYVHSRQRFSLGPRMAWFEEASAEYFAARLAMETGHASRVDYEWYLLRRPERPARLTDRASWTSERTPYDRGTVVLAALDGRIREETDGERTLEAVFRRLNRHDGPVTYPVFVATVNDVAGTDLSPWLDRHVAGTEPVRGPTTRGLSTLAGAASGPNPVPVGLGFSLLGGLFAARTVTS